MSFFYMKPVSCSFKRVSCIDVDLVFMLSYIKEVANNLCKVKSGRTKKVYSDFLRNYTNIY